jgi:hypothetical protein
MTEIVKGDPASISHTGGALRQLAARLRVSRRVARANLDLRSTDRPGPALAAGRRRAEAVDQATVALVDELDAVGAALQAHATDLAQAIADGRQVVARAVASGLRVSDGVVGPEWGVTGVADRGASAAQGALVAALQAELDAILSLMGRRRQRLAATLAESGIRVSSRAEELRR